MCSLNSPLVWHLLAAESFPSIYLWWGIGGAQQWDLSCHTNSVRSGRQRLYQPTYAIFSFYYFDIYRPWMKFVKVMFLHLSVSHSVHREGVSAPVHAGIYPLVRPYPLPWNKHPPPGADTPAAQCMLGCTPLGKHPQADTPPGADTPGSRHPLGADTPQVDIPWADTSLPPAQCMLGDTGNKRVVRILLECILVLYYFLMFRFDSIRFNSLTNIGNFGIRGLSTWKPNGKICSESKVLGWKSEVQCSILTGASFSYWIFFLFSHVKAFDVNISNISTLI